ncbi:MAG: class I SAM-dependent methyltransferase [Alphaproteobacteria bacterium]|nr:MAG: class I SAM-dependent methyltransferase [Alphaproteobacteria bacterium]PZO39319.1 MAG: class I SAM-dependent methyltransferase [Alphaproteobacteria bacterium]
MNLIHALQDNTNPDSLVSRFRRARARRIVALIEAIHARKGAVRIIDLGGEPDYWNLFDRAFLDRCGVHITLVNPGGFEGVDASLFEAVDGDACHLPQYADNGFDMVHSNSVVEHVGDWVRMEAFAAEVRRLAPCYYVQTPYFWFPIEPHFSAPFFHWRSEQSRARALMKRPHGFSQKAPDIGAAMRDVQHARLLDKTQYRFLFPDAEHHDEVVLGLTKSLIAVRS